LPIAFRAAGTAYEPTSTVTSAPLQTPSGVLSGDFLLACISTAGPNATEFSAPSGEGWTEGDQSRFNPGSGLYMHFFYKTSDGSEPSTHTFTRSDPNQGTAQATCGRLFAYSGVHTTTPIDVASTTVTSGSDQTIEFPAITPVTSGAWVLRYGAINQAGTSGNTIPAPTSHNGRGQWDTGSTIAKRPGALADIAWSGSGAQGATSTTVTGSTSGISGGISIALRPAPTGWTGSTPPNAILQMHNLTGTLADIDDDPDSPDTNWLIVG
jgi:hypothetical protein